MADYESILYKAEGGVATITLNRPDRMNALNRQMEQELVSAIQQVAGDDEVRVLVVTGAGRGFCSGADVGGMAGGAEPGQYVAPSADQIRRSFRGAQGVVLGLQRLEKPTIAMVNGAAAGAGFDLACACDLRTGSPNSRFVSAFIRIGLFPGWGGTWLYARTMGLPKAAELLFTGDFLEAEEAYRIGFLSRLAPQEELGKVTYELAGKIAAGPPGSAPGQAHAIQGTGDGPGDCYADGCRCRDHNPHLSGPQGRRGCL